MSTDLPTDTNHKRKAYFRSNVVCIVCLLAIWAFVSFGCGILLAPWLNQWTFFGSGYPLGFWFAQQGSIYVFVLLIFIYVLIMNGLDRRYSNQEPR